MNSALLILSFDANNCHKQGFDKNTRLSHCRRTRGALMAGNPLGVFSLFSLTQIFVIFGLELPLTQSPQGINNIDIDMKGKVESDDYRKQRNLTTAMNKICELTYFRARYEGGPKTQSLWRIIKPFMSHKIVLHETRVAHQQNAKIITDSRENVKMLLLISQPWQTILTLTIISQLPLILMMFFQMWW